MRLAAREMASVVGSTARRTARATLVDATLGWNPGRSMSDVFRGGAPYICAPAGRRREKQSRWGVQGGEASGGEGATMGGRQGRDPPSDGLLREETELAFVIPVVIELVQRGRRGAEAVVERVGRGRLKADVADPIMSHGMFSVTVHLGCNAYEITLRLLPL